MATTSVPLTYEASTDVTSNALSTWHGDGNPATYLTLNTGGTDSNWQAVPFGDLTSLASGVTGFQVEVDVSAGSSVLGWQWITQRPSEPLVFFERVLDLPGPGTHVFAGPVPLPFVEPPGFDLWGYVTAAMTDDPSALSSLTNVSHDVAEPSVTMTGFRLVLLTVTTEIRVTRQFPRDDAYGLGSAPRIFPPPRGGRLVGGYQ